MFEIGSYVMYENEGVCRVVDIAPYPYGNQEEPQKMYYQLSPVFKKGETIYVSVQTKARIRKMMTAQEAHRFMEQLTGIKPDIMRSRKPAQLTEHYKKNASDLSAGSFGIPDQRRLCEKGRGRGTEEKAGTDRSPLFKVGRRADLRRTGSGIGQYGGKSTGIFGEADPGRNPGAKGTRRSRGTGVQVIERAIRPRMGRRHRFRIIAGS